MDDYNVYPNQPFTPTIPQKQKTEEARSVEETLAQVPLLKKTVKRLDDRIAFYTSVDSIPAELHTKPDEFMQAYAANKLTAENLKDERSYIVSRVMNIK